jgi:hypothetical protein
MTEGEIVKIEWTETHQYSAYIRLPEGQTFDSFDQSEWDLSDALGEINTDTNFEGLERENVEIYTGVPPHVGKPPYEVEEIDWIPVER